MRATLNGLFAPFPEEITFNPWAGIDLFGEPNSFLPEPVRDDNESRTREEPLSSIPTITQSSTSSEEASCFTRALPTPETFPLCADEDSSDLSFASEIEDDDDEEDDGIGSLYRQFRDKIDYSYDDPGSYGDPEGYDTPEEDYQDREGCDNEYMSDEEENSAVVENEALSDLAPAQFVHAPSPPPPSHPLPANTVRRRNALRPLSSHPSGSSFNIAKDAGPSTTSKKRKAESTENAPRRSPLKEGIHFRIHRPIIEHIACSIEVRDPATGITRPCGLMMPNLEKSVKKHMKEHERNKTLPAKIKDCPFTQVTGNTQCKGKGDAKASAETFGRHVHCTHFENPSRAECLCCGKLSARADQIIRGETCHQDYGLARELKGVKNGVNGTRGHDDNETEHVVRPPRKKRRIDT